MGSRHFSGYVLSVVTAHKRGGGGVRWEEGSLAQGFFLKGNWLKEIWPDFPKTTEGFWD